MAKKNPFAHLGISWRSMKIGKFAYTGTYKGAKSNVCRANARYAPKTWKTYTKAGVVFVERVS